MVVLDVGVVISVAIVIPDKWNRREKWYQQQWWLNIKQNGERERQRWRQYQHMNAVLENVMEWNRMECYGMAWHGMVWIVRMGGLHVEKKSLRNQCFTKATRTNPRQKREYGMRTQLYRKLKQAEYYPSYIHNTL